jgi:hypothetical protein
LVGRLRGCLDMSHDRMWRSNDALLESETWSGVASDPHGVFAKRSRGSTEGVAAAATTLLHRCRDGAEQRKPRILTR